MHRFDRLALVLLLALAHAGCANIHWERSVYDGMRQGAENAARLPGASATPQATPLPPHAQYERERAKLRTADIDRAPPTPAAHGTASGAAR